MTTDQMQAIHDIFAKAKADVEALLKPKDEPKCDGFREPWMHGTIEPTAIVDCRGTVLWRPIDGKANFSFVEAMRLIVCVNALTGVADPAAFVAKAKRLEDWARACPKSKTSRGWKWVGADGRDSSWLYDGQQILEAK